MFVVSYTDGETIHWFVEGINTIVNFSLADGMCTVHGFDINKLHHWQLCDLYVQ